MPNNAKGRSNYRVAPGSAVQAKGYAKDRFSHVRIQWDATRTGDPGFADCEFIEAPVDQDTLTAIVEGLNAEKIADRWDLG